MLMRSSRRALAVLSCTLVAGGLAACGSGDDAGGGSAGGAPAGDVDGRALLSDAFAKYTPDGGPIKSLTAGITISGKVDAPKDKDLRSLDGKVALTVSAEGLDQKSGTPPVKVGVSVDGDYVDGSGKAGSGKYDAGVTYTDQQLFVNWKGKDYAFGEALTKQFSEGFKQSLENRAGAAAADTSELKDLSADPGKVFDAMDLDPGTWVEDVRVSDGPTIDGVATYEITGPVDIKATAADLSDGLKKLPAAFPKVPGLKELEDMGSVSDKDVAKAEKALTTRNLTVWVGKDDRIQRRVKIDIAGKDDSDGEPMSVDLSIQFDTTKVNKPQGITAPKGAAPVTDLFVALQQDFPGIGALLGGG